MRIVFLATLLSFLARTACAQILTGSFPILLTSTEDVQSISVTEFNKANVKVKYFGVAPIFTGPGYPNTPNFIVIVPAVATTPALFRIGVNPAVALYLAPGGTYSLGVGFTTVDQTPASSVGRDVDFRVPDEPPPSIQSVVNSASLQPYISPGSLISVFGSNLTGPTLTTEYDATAMYPTSVAGTSVLFNDIPAPLRYLSPGQINAIVPYALAGQTNVKVVVQRFKRATAAFTVPLQDTSPGIFTATQNGTGLGAVRQKGPDGQFTYNSLDNPAASGASLEIFATGAGVWTPQPLNDVYLDGVSFTARPVSLTIGDKAAKVLTVGTSGVHGSWSVLQVNAVVPDNTGSGAQPVVLKIGQYDNSAQKVVVWVK